MGRIRRIFLSIIIDVDIAGSGRPDTDVTFVKNINEKKQIFVSRFWFLNVILTIHVVVPEVSLVHPNTIYRTFTGNVSFTEPETLFERESIWEQVWFWCNSGWHCCFWDGSCG
jgi:hypothetical protein